MGRRFESCRAHHLFDFRLKLPSILPLPRWFFRFPVTSVTRFGYQRLPNSRQFVAIGPGGKLAYP